MTQERLKRRRTHIVLAHIMLAYHARRLRAWQHRPYEAPLCWQTSDRGIVIHLGADGFRGGHCGIRIARSAADFDALIAAIAALEPLDRDPGRCGCGEDLGRVVEALQVLPALDRAQAVSDPEWSRGTWHECHA
jgi:hypothetical protein